MHVHRSGIMAASASLLLAAAQAPQIVGSWRGRSTCADKVHFPGCTDETVIYDVQAHPGSPDTVTVSADKIVNGARVPMGAFDFTRRPDGSWAVEFATPRTHARIVLRIAGTQMTGSLIDIPTGRQVRDLALERVPARRTGSPD